MNIMVELEFKLALIKLVQENKCLYDKSDIYYYSKVNRETAWWNIAKKLGRTVQDCRSAWKGLRELYYKKAKYHTQQAPTGDTLHEWPYFKPMAFLKSNIEFYSRTPNMANRIKTQERQIHKEAQLAKAPEKKRPRLCPSTPDPEMDATAVNVEYILESDEHIDKPADNRIATDEDSNHSAFVEEYLDDTVHQRHSRSEQNEFKQLCRQFYQTMSKLEDTLSNLSADDEVDPIKNDPEDAVFLQSISTLMKTLPVDIKDEFQSNMYAQVFKLRAQVRRKTIEN